MIKFIIQIFKRFAWFKRFNAKVTYELLAKNIPAEDWHFMNYGYTPNSTESILDLPNDPKIQKYSLQMYHYLAAKTDLLGKHVLEIGSGRGGGAKHVASHYKPASYVGLDIAASAVDLANKIHQVSGLKFIQGSAEKIPLADNSIDVVLNVESSHGYGNVDTFLNEVRRVLKPGGKLLMVDFRNSVENMTIFQNQIKNSGLQQLSQEDITPNVVQSIETEDDSKKERIKKLIPARWQKLFNEFAGVVGSRFYETLKNGTRPYYRFVLTKTQ
ncbi:MAG: class I SAM-dependent methyltransferase [Cyclobacteriaceae bacterium]|nr:class I SAM-dependent methyltransferase [Cyclobacteriaceae bacterium]